MTSYLEINRKAFEKLAVEYNSLWKKYTPHQEKVLKPFENKLKKLFKGKIKILDVGCGVGLDSHILSKHGFQVYAVDMCTSMVKFARSNAPAAKVIKANFLEVSIAHRFNGVVLDAFIHLFPKSEVPYVLKKLKKLLKPNGLLLICTTIENVSSEGYMKKKYKTKTKRFRALWKKNELVQTIKQNGFTIVQTYVDQDPFVNRKWVNVIATISKLK